MPDAYATTQSPRSDVVCIPPVTRQNRQQQSFLHIPFVRRVAAAVFERSRSARTRQTCLQPAGTPRRNRFGIGRSLLAARRRPSTGTAERPAHRPPSIRQRAPARLSARLLSHPYGEYARLRRAASALLLRWLRQPQNTGLGSSVLLRPGLLEVRQMVFFTMVLFNLFEMVLIWHGCLICNVGTILAKRRNGHGRMKHR
jgi:hypothetical protein